MAEYVGSLLLVLLGVSGLVFMLGRAARAPMPQEEPAVTEPSARLVSAPARTRWLNIMRLLRQMSAAFFRVFARTVFRGAVKIGPALLRLARFRSARRLPARMSPLTFELPKRRLDHELKRSRPERGEEHGEPVSGISIEEFRRLRAAPFLHEADAEPLEKEPAKESPELLSENHEVAHKEDTPSAGDDALHVTPPPPASLGVEPTQKTVFEPLASQDESFAPSEAAHDIAPVFAESSILEDESGSERESVLQHSAMAEDAELKTRSPQSGEQAETVAEVQRTVSLQAHVDTREEERRKVVGSVRTSRRGRPKRHTEAADRAPSVSVPAAELEVELDDLQRAARCIEEGDYARAESILTDVLTADPRGVEAYRLLGTLYINKGDFVQAKEVCEEALRRHPEEVALYGTLGRAYVELGQYGKALQMYQRAHDADESNLGYLEQLLRIASRMDRRPLVRVTAEKILAVDAQHAEARKQLEKVALVT